VNTVVSHEKRALPLFSAPQRSLTRIQVRSRKKITNKKSADRDLTGWYV